MAEKSGLKSSRRAVALEPRLLFDASVGAAADPGADPFFDEAPNKQIEQPEKSYNPLSGDMGYQFLSRFGITTFNVEAPIDPERKPTILVGEDSSVEEPVIVGHQIKLDKLSSTDSYDVTVSVEKGILTTDQAGASIEGDGKKITFTGTKEEIKSFFSQLKYAYDGESETGDTDVLTIGFLNRANPLETGLGAVQLISITPENDAPEIDRAHANYERLQVKEGGAASFATAEGLLDPELKTSAWQKNIGLIDPDNQPEQIILKLNSLPTHGQLFLDGVLLAKGATFSLADIDRLSYTHNGEQITEETTDSFDIIVDDGAGGIIGLDDVQTVFIDLLPVNQLPTISGSVTIIQGEGAISLGQSGQTLPVIGGDRGHIAGVDPDDKSLTYVVTELPTHGTLYYGTGQARIAVTADFEVEDLTELYFEYPQDLEPSKLPVPGFVTFKMTVQDQGGGTGTPSARQEVTVDLTILDNNNDPYFDLTLPGPVDGVITITDVDYETVEKAGNVVTITADMLPLKDDDSFNPNLVFTIKNNTNTTGGYFTLDGKLLGDGTSFSYADLVREDGSGVKYHFFGNGIEGHLDYIDFTVTDSATTLVFSAVGEAFARDGGIYEAGSNKTLQTFRLAIKVPVTTGEGELPELPDLVERFDIDKNIQLDILESQGNNEAEKGVSLKDHLSVKAIGKESGDLNVSTDKIVYRLDTAVTTGTLWLNGKALKQHDSFTQADVDSGKVVYTHNGNETFTDSFHFSISVGSKTQADATQVFTIKVTPQNDTPTASVSEIVLAEGDEFVFKNEITLSDKDNTGSYSDKPYDTENTLHFIVTKLPTAGLLLLNGVEVIEGQEIDENDVSKLTYKHSGKEVYKDSFSIRPKDDQGVVGELITETNQSSLGEEVTLDITITPRNDAPTFVAKKDSETGAPKMTEGGEITIWGAAKYENGLVNKDGSGTAIAPTDKDYFLIYQDTDNSKVQRQYRVTEAPKHGTLLLNGKALSKGSIFTQADLDRGAIQYKHAGTPNYADKFEYVVSDGDWTSNEQSGAEGLNTKEEQSGAIYKQGTPKNEIDTSTYHIEIAPANDAPTVSVDTGTIYVKSTTEGTDLGRFTIRDPDQQEQVTAPDVEGVFTDFIQVTVSVNDNAPFVLELPESSGVTVVTTSEGKLVFQGEMSKVQAALDTVKVKVKVGTPDNDLNKEFKITVTVDDRMYNDQGVLIGGANGGETNEANVPLGDAFNTDSVQIIIRASLENNKPIITAPESISINEDGWDGTKDKTYSKLDGGIEFSDADDFGSANNWLIVEVGTQGKLFFFDNEKDNKAGKLPAGVTLEEGAVGANRVVLKGTQADLNNALTSLYYSSVDKNFNGSDELKVTVNDGGNMGLEAIYDSANDSETSHITIHIIPVNDKPELTVVEEGKVTLSGSYEFSTANNNAIQFSDPDRVSMDNGHQSAASDHKYIITLDATVAENKSFGEISFKGLDLDELPLGIEAVESSDGANGKLVIMGTYADLCAALNQGVIYTPGSDAAYEDAEITFTVTVNDQGDGGTALTDTETKTTGLVAGLEDTKSFIFQRTDKNDAPSFSGLDNTPTYVQNSNKAVVLDADATLADPELDLFGNWSGATLVLETNSDESLKEFDIFGTTGSGDIGVNIAEGKIRIDTEVVGSVQIEDGKLTICFDQKQVTKEQVNAVLQAITYENNDPDPDSEVVVRYTIFDGNPNAAVTSGEDNIDDTGKGQDQGTGGQLKGDGEITVRINRQVVAVDDENRITEDTSSVIGDLTPKGNNDSDKEQDYDPDSDQEIVVETITGVDGEEVELTETGETSAQGEYGTLYVKPDGSYRYELNNADLAVQALIPGDTLTDTFTYGVSDNQGEFSTFATADLVITIEGANDKVEVTVTDGGVDSPHQVYESGLATGSGQGSTTTDIDSSFTFTALDGLGTVELKVNGQITSFTKDQIEKLTSTPQTIETQFGTLTLTGYQLDNDGLATIDYTYTLTKNSTGHGSEQEVFDTIEVNVSDRGGADKTTENPNGIDSATATIQIQIVDDAPNTADDTNSVRSGQSISGNVIEGLEGQGADASGADGWKQVDGKDVPVVGVMKGNSGSVHLGSVASEIQGDFGTLTLQADGSYTYKADANTPAGSKDYFTYTVEDADGDTSTAILTITITDKNLDITDQVEIIVYEKYLPEGSEPNNDELTVGKELPIPTLPEGVSFDPETPLEITEDPSYGTVTISWNEGSPTFTYTLTTAPNENAESVIDSFTYTVKDQFGNTETYIVNVTIVDDSPVASLDTNTIKSGDTLIVGKKDGVLNNDVSGADGWAESGAIVGVSQGTASTDPSISEVDENGNYEISGLYGKLRLNVDGSYTYEAEPNRGGRTDVFTYFVQDKDGDRTETTLSITITQADNPGVEQPPVEPTEGVVYESHLSSGSKPQDNGAQAVGRVSASENGSVPVQKGKGGYGTFEIDATGKYIYTLTEAVSKSITEDTFEYRYVAADGNVFTQTVTVQIVDDAPASNADSNTVTAGRVVSGDLLENDRSGADGWLENQDKTDKAPVTLVSFGEHIAEVDEVTGAYQIEGLYGTLVVHTDGSYEYTAQEGVRNKTDVFSYQVQDSDGDVSESTLTIRIVDKQPPVAEDDAYRTRFDTPVSENILKNDYDPDGESQTSKDLTITQITVSGKSVKPTEHGVFEVEITEKGNKVGTLVVEPDGELTFTPVDGWTGKVPPIEYTVVDKDGHKDKATVTIVVTPPIPPIATPDSFTTTVDDPVSGNILKNDYDPDGTSENDLTVTEITVDGKKYPLFELDDDDEPKLDDDGNKIPVSVKDIPILDKDGETAGTIAVKPDGTFTFTPKDGWTGKVPPIDYTIVDKDGGTDSSKIYITVTPEDITPPIEPSNRPPVANPDFSSTSVNTPVSGEILSNDFDPDEGDKIIVTEVTVDGATHKVPSTGKLVVPVMDGNEKVGELEIDAKGKYTYTPVDDVTGDAPTIDYTITDGSKTASSTLHITVTPEPEANDKLPPVAKPDHAVTRQDEPIKGNILTNDYDPDGTPTATDYLTVTEITVDGKTYPLYEEDADGNNTPTLVKDIPVLDKDGKTPAGTIMVEPDGTFTFTPAKDWSGQVPPIGYEVVDADNKSATSTLTIQVIPKPEVPTLPEDIDFDVIALPNIDTIKQGESSTGNILADDISTTGGELRVTELTVNGEIYNLPDDGSSIKVPVKDENDKTIGQLTISSTGEYTFVPNKNWYGKIPTIEYVIEGKEGDDVETDNSTLDITVLPDLEPKPDPTPTPTPKPDPKPEPTPEEPKPEEPKPEEPKPEEPEPGEPDSETPAPVEPELPIHPETDTPQPTVPESELPPEETIYRPDISTSSDVVTPGSESMRLQPLNPLFGDQVRDPGVFFDGGIQTRIQRMPIPFHPIVYVNNEVRSAQFERMASDSMFRSRVAAVELKDIQIESLGAGLGQDPALFVQHAVRTTQGQASFMGLIVEGRLGRVSLSSDLQIPTPGLIDPSEKLTVDSQTTSQPASEDAQADTVQSDQTALFESNMDELVLSITDAITAEVGAESFNDLLQQGSQRLPAPLFNVV